MDELIFFDFCIVLYYAFMKLLKSPKALIDFFMAANIY